MKVSKTCLTLVQKWEGFYTNAYLCPAGVWTIGYGTTVWPNGKRVKKGDTITREEASKLLEKQVNEHANTIVQYVKVPLNQNQYDALASFQYNLGRHILKGSYLVKYLNAKQWAKAANSMMQYCKARNPKTGKLEVLRGLENRRKEEVTLFLKHVANIQVKEEGDLVFSSPTLEANIEALLKDKLKQKELIEKAIAAGAINVSWRDKYNQGKLAKHDILGLSALYAVAK